MKPCWFSALLLAQLALGQDYSAPKKPSADPVPSPKPSAQCPWLTQGSAASALGGEVHVSVIVVSPSQGTCSFVRQDLPAAHLKIFVGPASIPSCPQASERAVGVGTRASRCRVSASTGDSTEMISGAVRQTGLAILLGRSKTDPRAKRDLLEELAEQVAGNLF